MNVIELATSQSFAIISAMKNKIIFADQLRALAIISVVISHYFGIFWFDASLSSYINASESLGVVAPRVIAGINYIGIPTSLGDLLG